MSAGFIATKSNLDQRLASLVVAGESWFDDVRRMKLWLDDPDTPDLAALGYTGTEGPSDIQTIQNTATALDHLRLTAYGLPGGTVPALDNHFFWGWKLRKFL